MNISELSIRRPVFVTCLLILIMVLGGFAFKKLPVDLFPDVTFPFVMVSTPYPGAGPREIETSVSKPLEEELGTIAGVKTIRSKNTEGLSVVSAEFTLGTDVKYAEQQVRDKVSSARRKLPTEIKEPVIRRMDPADQPVLMITLNAKLPMAKHYDLANEVVRPKIETVPGVGLVEVVGGRKREIHVELDRKKLAQSQLSATAVSERLKMTGQNIPAGSVSRDNGQDVVFRTVGEFESVRAVEEAAVNFFGNDRAIQIRDLGTVKDTLADPNSYTMLNGESTLLLWVFKQTGSNTVAVSESIKARIAQLQTELKEKYKDAEPELNIVSNQARYIGLNVADVEESIAIGILLTILVVYFFLGSVRSTLITGVAIPVSLVGAFALMWIAGFSINVMSLLAFSLAVGLLIDDAIVVRENIFRHLEMGKSPKRAALEGTLEVNMAVIAVTLTIISVFMPVGFMSGVVGQFFKQFGLSVCFIMAISLFDALTNAPMMSAYFGGTHSHQEPKNPIAYFLRAPVRLFERGFASTQQFYVGFIRVLLKRPWLAIVATFVVAASSCIPFKNVPKNFLPAQDSGEFSVGLDMVPGTSLEKMRDRSLDIDKVIRSHPEVVNTVLTVGNRQLEKNKAEFYVFLRPFGTRKKSTSDVKAELRNMLKEHTEVNPVVKDIDYVGGGMRPFMLNIVGHDLTVLEPLALKLKEKLKDHPALLDVDTSFRPGKPEFQVKVDLDEAQRLGVSSSAVGAELRAQVEGVTSSVFRENGLEYDIRVRLQPDQRDLESNYSQILVPNMNNRLVELSRVAKSTATTSPASIDRENRGRYVSVMADIAPTGPGMGGAIDDINSWLKPGGELAVPSGVTYRFVGQAENFQELGVNMIIAFALGVIFIYLILSSLYESFFMPLTIMFVIPFAMCGAFWGLWMFGKSLDLYSAIGCIMLTGLATKNSIIMVDYIFQLMEKGMGKMEAVVEAGRTRLRPILMTSLCLIAGMIPIAIGLNEVSNQRSSLGAAVIGGVVSSTLLTLIALPAVFIYMDSLRNWLLKFGRRLVTQDLVQSAGGLDRQ
jgi:HAE1 family hydrophobic/amphiphilic exporter-1